MRERSSRAYRSETVQNTAELEMHRVRRAQRKARRHRCTVDAFLFRQRQDRTRVRRTRRSETRDGRRRCHRERRIFRSAKFVEREMEE